VRGGGNSISFSNAVQQHPGARRSPSLQSMAGSALPSARSAEDAAAEWLEHTFRVVIDEAKSSGKGGESFRTNPAGWVRTSPFTAGGMSTGEVAARADGADGCALPGGRRRGYLKSRSLLDLAADRQGAAGPEPSPRSARENRKTAEGVAGKSAQALRRGLGV
jgi:hypothetical protein